jgi:3-oxoadipate enol-lactonase
VLTAIANPLPATMDAQAPDRYLTVAGARLRYRDEGSGAAVLLLHGWTLDLEMWNALAGALRATLRVIRLDRRGFGLSSGRPALEHDIADLDALWRHLGLERAALVGMSQGARAVMGFAAITERNISCLVLDGPPDMARDAREARFDDVAADDDLPLAHYSALVRTRGIDAFRRAWATHPLMRLHTGDRNARALLQAIIGRYPGNDLRQGAVDASAQTGVRAAAPAATVRPESIEVPVLLITGEHDLALRIRAADLLARRLSGAERAVVAAAGHLPNLDNPVAYNNLVREFLHRHAGSRT